LQAPLPKKRFDGIYSAKKYAPDCIQTNYGVVLHREKGKIIIGNENCLTCNIYTPQVDKIT
jgi:carboxylesterase type B